MSSSSWLPGQESVQVFIPILVGVLAFVEDLESELVVVEALAEPLPSHFVPDLLEYAGNALLVVGVRVALRVPGSLMTTSRRWTTTSC